MALSPDTVEAIRKQLEGLSEEEQQKKFQEILSTLSSEDREQLAGKQECPFCLMAKGDIPTKKVYEDDTLLAVLDIRPATRGHTLLFPKEHHRVLSTVPEPLVAHLFSVANTISTAVFDATNAQGTNILVANGPAAGQTAPHVLVNIIPRFAKDGVVLGWDAKKTDEQELDALAETIRKKFPKEKPKIEKKEEKISIPKGKIDRIP